MSNKNIFPHKNKFVSRNIKEQLIHQRGLVIWFTGLSGSGKSTLATKLEQRLSKVGYLTEVLDGDKIRNNLNNDLGFSLEDRIENIRRIAEVSKLFCNCGIITISAFISPTIEIREMARNIISNNDYFEVFLSTPLNICEQRDNKGLYKKARNGALKDFTGISAPYEIPVAPNIIINTEDKNVEECANKIFNSVIERINITTN